MKKFLQIFAVIIAFIAVYNVNAQTVVSTDPLPRNAVLEEFTGIYCGYCPQGHAIAQGLIEQYPGRVIAINIHTGGYANPSKASDPDFRTDWGAAIAGISGLTGYPAGQVNRQLITGSALAMSRSAWSAAAQTVMNDVAGSPLNIGAKTTWNPSTKTLEILVEVYFTKDVPNNVKLNVAFMQSHVFGYQSGGSDNYDHQHILRDLLTGQWGETITETTQGSLFTKTYTYTLEGKKWADISGAIDPLGKQFDINNCDITIFATKDDNKYIYTGINVPAITPNLIITADNNIFSAIANGSSFEKTVTVSNTTTTAFTADATVELTSRTPANWSASIVGGANLTIPAGGSADVTFKLTPGATLGIGDATLVITETNVGVPLSYSTKITAVSAEVTNIEINDDAVETNTILPSLVAAGKTGFVTLSYDEYNQAKANLNQPNFIVWNTGKKGGLSTEEATLIDAMIKVGVKVLFNGSVAIPFLTFEAPSHPLLTTLGINWSSGDIELQTLDLVGVVDDPISDGWEARNLTNVSTNNGYYVQSILITNKNTTKSFIECAQNDYTVGVRVENQYGRSVYLGVNSEVISDVNKRNELIEKSIIWIEGTTEVEENVYTNGSLSISANPNPIETATTINYSITNSQNVRISLVNELGQEVSLIFEGNVTAGSHTTNYNVNSLANGTYYMVMKSGTELVSMPVVIVK